MKKVLVAYMSMTGYTQKMAESIVEGIQESGNEAVLKKVLELKDPESLKGYDGYIFGSPTYYRNMTAEMQDFLLSSRMANLSGKVGGAFGSYMFSGEAGKLIFETMEFVFKMDMLALGSLDLKEPVVPTEEGIMECRNYGEAMGERLAK
jgi:flavorubredoxin